MCDCIKKKQERIKNNLSEKNEEYKDRTITKVEIQNTAIIFKGKTLLQVYSPLKVEYDVLNKKGVLMHKKEVTNLIYKYCPFCGEKYE